MTIHHIFTNGDAILMGLRVAFGLFLGARAVELIDYLRGRSS